MCIEDYQNYNTAKNVEYVYLKSTMEALVFDILICWKWLGTNHKHVSWP